MENELCVQLSTAINLMLPTIAGSYGNRLDLGPLLGANKPDIN